jgi:hypothetical protein
MRRRIVLRLQTFRIDDWKQFCFFCANVRAPHCSDNMSVKSPVLRPDSCNRLRERSPEFETSAGKIPIGFPP